MTEQELLDDGWKPELCKIGTLYFKDGFFCRFKELGKVIVFSVTDDMNQIGVAENVKHLEEVQKQYYKNIIKKLKINYEVTKEYYEKKYKEKLDI